MASNRDIWSCGLWSYTFHLNAEKTILLILPLLSFHVQQTSPNYVGSVAADIIPDNNIIRHMWSN